MAYRLPKITSEEMNNCLTLLYGSTATAHLNKGEAFNLAHVVQTAHGDRFQIGDQTASGLTAPEVRRRFRVNACAVTVKGMDGAQVTARRIENEPPILAHMDIEPGILRSYRPRNGIVLICGRTGTGKTRLQAGMTRSLLECPDFHGKIIELASPIEYEFHTVIQSCAMYSASELPRNFKQALVGMQEALRRAFNVLISPECRDRETMEVAIMGAQTGHTVYSTVHTNSVLETIQRILAMFPQSERDGRAVSLMQSLRLIVNCELVPSTDPRGRQMQLREYLPFGPEDRKDLLSIPVINWPDKIRELIKTKGQSYAMAAKKALDAKMITEETAATFAEDY